METPRNPRHNADHGTDGYRDLGWQNEWRARFKTTESGIKALDGYDDQPEFNACREAKHKKREIDNSMHLCRGTDNLVICDICKHFSHFDCSD